MMLSSNNQNTSRQLVFAFCFERPLHIPKARVKGAYGTPGEVPQARGAPALFCFERLSHTKGPGERRPWRRLYACGGMCYNHGRETELENIEEVIKMAAEEFWFNTHNSIKLYLRKWKCGSRPRALLHIIHGLGEHGGRYAETAEFLSAAGIEVWCADRRGSGKTADITVNDAGNGGLHGHCADKNAVTKVILDINKINEKMKDEYPQLPLFVLGHSFGSFLAQYLVEFSKMNFSGCILSGTKGPGGFEIKAGAAFARFLAARRGVREKSLLLNSLVFGSYNKTFEPSRTNFDWLSRDTAIVDAYITDPLCGQVQSIGFFHDMLLLLQRVHRNRNIDRIRRALPVYIFSGSKDPVGETGESVTTLVNRYKKIGIKDLEYVLYPDARHECLNEINREEVRNNLMRWLERHI
jgi:alpha-beta hydrolase superfamily lysophospholipase